MLSKKFKDLKLRQTFYKQELNKKMNKFLFIHFLSRNLKKNFISNYNFKNKISSKVKIHNRCAFTNRNRGSIKAYSISRVYMRELLQLGIIPGFQKAVW